MSDRSPSTQGPRSSAGSVIKGEEHVHSFHVISLCRKRVDRLKESNLCKLVDLPRDALTSWMLLVKEDEEKNLKANSDPESEFMKTDKIDQAFKDKYLENSRECLRKVEKGLSDPHLFFDDLDEGDSSWTAFTFCDGEIAAHILFNNTIVTQKTGDLGERDLNDSTIIFWNGHEWKRKGKYPDFVKKQMNAQDIAEMKALVLGSDFGRNKHADLVHSPSDYTKKTDTKKN